MRRQRILVVGSVAVFLAVASAQAPARAAQQTTPAPAFVNLSKVSNDYQVGPGDQLEIQVVAHPELNQTLRLSNSGEISLPPIGLICVAGLTAFDVESTIAERLRERNLIQHPEVLVFISDYRAKPIYVSGAVVNPGEFVMSQELTVADAILLAGGLQLIAADEGLVHRRVSGEGRSEPARPCSGTPRAGPGMETIKVDLRPLKEGRFFQSALPLKPGDVVIVPEMQVNPFFIVGDVMHPRNYSYPPGQTLMASQAISLAGGPTPTSKLSDGMLVRYDDQGRRTDLPVNYAAILSGRQPDFPIEPNDIIFIPGSAIKTFTHGLLLLTDSMVSSAIFRVGRTYQLPDPPERTVREPR